MDQCLSVLFLVIGCLVCGMDSLCPNHSSVVKLCQDGSGNGTSVYLEADGAILWDVTTCFCTLNITSWTPPSKVRVKLSNPIATDMELFINDLKVNTSVDDARNFSSEWTIRFEKNTTDSKSQCYELTKEDDTTGSVIQMRCYPTKQNSTGNTSMRAASSLVTSTQSSSNETDTNTAGKQKNNVDGIFIGVGAVVGAFTAVVIAVITLVVVRRRRGVRGKGRKEYTLDSSDKENDYNICLKMRGVRGKERKEDTLDSSDKEYDCNICLKMRGVCGKGRKEDTLDSSDKENDYNICLKMRGVCGKRRKEYTLDSSDKENDCHMATNAGYISAADCEKETGPDQVHDAKRYTMIKELRKQQSASGEGEGEDVYDHLNDVLCARRPENIYNTASVGVDTSDYIRINEVEQKVENDKVHDVTGSKENPKAVYDHIKAPTYHVYN